MARKVIIDCAPGIDDAIALTLALFHPDLEVVAVTATEGHVTADLSNRNAQAIIDALDPPRLPRLGTASPAEGAPDVKTRRLNGEDGLGNVGIAVARLHQQHPSEKIICDEVRASPEGVTIICLGPLTNIARAFQRDAELQSMVDRLIIAGGSVNGVGNVTAAAEFNMFFDPMSARSVFRSRTTKTLIPLDVVRKVPFTLDFQDQLPPETTSAGQLLRRIVPFYYLAFHQMFGLESIELHRTLAVLAAIYPEMFATRGMPAEIETSGWLTTGATIFDRRPVTELRNNMEVAVDVDVAKVRDALARGLQEAH